MDKKKEILAYIAGLFDGEGSITIQKRTNKNKNSYHWLRIQIANTNYDLIVWLQKMIGGHIVSHQGKSPRKLCYIWLLVSNPAKEFLKLIYPYLIIKKSKTEIAIEYQNEVGGDMRSKHKFLTPEIIEKRDWYRKKILFFNKETKNESKRKKPDSTRNQAR